MSIQDIAQQLYESFNNRAVEQYAKQYFHPNAVIIDVPTGQESHGPQGIVENATMWTTAFPDGKIKIVDMKVSGNVVTTIFRGQGTFTGKFMTPEGSIPGNGRKLDLEFEDILEFQEGKIIHNETRYDMQAMMQQLGLG